MAKLRQKASVSRKECAFSKKTEQKYIRLLVNMMVYRCIDSQTLHLLTNRSNDVTSILKRAIEENHIHKLHYRFYKKNHCKDITAYRITKKGVKYIAANNVVQSLAKIDEEEMKGIEVTSRGDRQKTRYEAAVRQAKVAILAAVSGANINLFQLQPTYREAEKEQNVLGDFIKNNMTSQDLETIENNISWNKCDDINMQFYDGALVKSTAADEQDENNSVLKTTQVKGILESEVKTVMMYTPPLFGLTWNIKNNRREIYVCKKWFMETQTNKTRDFTVRAMIVVNNSREFYNFYTDKYQAQTNQSKFGGEFVNVYIIPCTHLGASFMKWIMSYDDDDIVRAVVTSVVQGGNVKYNYHKTKSFFPLCDDSGCEIAVCLTFDVKLIRLIDEYARSQPTKQFKIICFDWQIAYYQKVLPKNVLYATTEF